MDDVAKLIPNGDKASIHEISRTFNRYIFKTDDDRLFMVTPVNIVGNHKFITVVSKVLHGFSDAEHIESIVDCEMSATDFVSKMGEVIRREVSGRTLQLDVSIPITKTIEEDKVEVYFIRSFPIKGVDSDE